jgi:hypothetical protein
VVGWKYCSLSEKLDPWKWLCKPFQSLAVFEASSVTKSIRSINWPFFHALIIVPESVMESGTIKNEIVFYRIVRVSSFNWLEFQYIQSKPFQNQSLGLNKRETNETRPDLVLYVCLFVELVARDRQALHFTRGTCHTSSRHLRTFQTLFSERCRTEFNIIYG